VGGGGVKEVMPPGGKLRDVDFLMFGGVIHTRFDTRPQVKHGCWMGSHPKLCPPKSSILCTVVSNEVRKGQGGGQRRDFVSKYKVTEYLRDHKVQLLLELHTWPDLLLHLQVEDHAE